MCTCIWGELEPHMRQQAGGAEVRLARTLALLKHIVARHGQLHGARGIMHVSVGRTIDGQVGSG